MRIIIEDLEVFAFHGVNEEEQRLGQIFLVCAEIELASQLVVDSIENTVNYSSVCKLIVEKMTATKYNLIETCTQEVALSICNRFFGVKSVKVTVKKPNAPMKQTFNYVATQCTYRLTRAYLGLGSNLGNREDYLNRAIEGLRQCGRVVKVSSFLDNPALTQGQPNYLNLALALDTYLSPYMLLAKTQEIERSLGRQRAEKWASRTIDIDILLFGKEIIDSDELVVPHPRMHERQFVLAPLEELGVRFPLKYD